MAFGNVVHLLVCFSSKVSDCQKLNLHDGCYTDRVAISASQKLSERNAGGLRTLGMAGITRSHPSTNKGGSSGVDDDTAGLLSFSQGKSNEEAGGHLLATVVPQDVDLSEFFGSPRTAAPEQCAATIDSPEFSITAAVASCGHLRGRWLRAQIRAPITATVDQIDEETTQRWVEPGDRMRAMSELRWNASGGLLRLFFVLVVPSHVHECGPPMKHIGMPRVYIEYGWVPAATRQGDAVLIDEESQQPLVDMLANLSDTVPLSIDAIRDPFSCLFEHDAVQPCQECATNATPVDVAGRNEVVLGDLLDLL
eukprot:SAG31_NODE_4698_length_3026_cov_1.767680_3_plen_309_part_00